MIPLLQHPESVHKKERKMLDTLVAVAYYTFSLCGPIAQLVELPAHNRSVPGSNPGGPTTITSFKGMPIKRYCSRQPASQGKKKSAHLPVALFFFVSL